MSSTFSGNSYPSGGLENNCLQRTTVRTHDPKQNQDLNLLRGSKSVNNPEQPRSNNRSNDMKKSFSKSNYWEDLDPYDDPTSFGYTPFGMISKKHGVKVYSDQSIPIEQFVLGVSETVNLEHIIAASRMRSGVVICCLPLKMLTLFVLMVYL
jgi:hypothetical protein